MRELVEMKEITKEDYNKAIQEYKKQMIWRDHFGNTAIPIAFIIAALIVYIISNGVGWPWSVAVMSSVFIILFMRYGLGIIMPHEAAKVWKILINKTSKG